MLGKVSTISDMLPPAMTAKNGDESRGGRYWQCGGVANVVSRKGGVEHSVTMFMRTVISVEASCIKPRVDHAEAFIHARDAICAFTFSPMEKEIAGKGRLLVGNKRRPYALLCRICFALLEIGSLRRTSQGFAILVDCFCFAGRCFSIGITCLALLHK